LSILCYHTISRGWNDPLAVTPEAFDEQCTWLARRRQVVDLGTAVQQLDASMRLARGLAAVTFDDGFSDLYDHGWPVLRRHGIPATIFLVAKTLTGEPFEVDWIGRPTPPVTTLTVEQVQEMRAGGVHFGSHSMRHDDLTTLTEAECVADLRTSREILAEILGEPVPFLAYPKGRHAPHVRAAARKAGYTHSFTLPESREEPGLHAVPRVGVFPGNGIASLQLKSSRSYLRLRTSPLFPAARRVVTRRATTLAS
jgi:peptidoglycan/xylan/chitin deacetylase (PgdA/CDA1 family)